ncbi:triphosphoribosyl-dephospho-CoA synthase MdcB [Psychrobacter fozii]|uniref:triphosphoribosyl-dephospho-CoA synthase MdcB n=1 Tax=Psychrobacter fozii TaxID=198480 RepID=UPI0019191E1A|nr:triphosphoribosyl-dephospho-CoA synthase MdcB [Psychrobacter fozii]
MNLNTLLDRTNKPLLPTQAVWQQIDELACEALYDELSLENKPGLVCPSSNGSHTDMNHLTFINSINSLKGYFSTLSQFGHDDRPFDDLKNMGIYQEAKMREATNNINTHKGAIFNLGFVCAAIGRCIQAEIPLTAKNICEQLVDRWQFDLTTRLQREPDSHGQKMFKKYGITGAIEMVSNGFEIILTDVLPCFYDTIYSTRDFEKASMQSLMTLISVLSDTNIVWRGGIKDLENAQVLAKQFLQAGGVHQSDWRQKVSNINQYFIHNNLSPGGSADLLAVTIFFYKVENEFNYPI